MVVSFTPFLKRVTLTLTKNFYLVWHQSHSSGGGREVLGSQRNPADEVRGYLDIHGASRQGLKIRCYGSIATDPWPEQFVGDQVE